MGGAGLGVSQVQNPCGGHDKRGHQARSIGGARIGREGDAPSGLADM
jgi:hypothetical protein